MDKNLDPDIWKSAKELMVKFQYKDKSSIYRFVEKYSISKVAKNPRFFLYNLVEFEAAKKEEERSHSYRRVTNDSESDSKESVIKWLNKEPLTVSELSRRLDRSKETIVRILDEIHADGIDVTYDDASKQAAISKQPFKFKEALPIEPFYRNKIKIGCISDLHLGSKQQQLTLAKTAYKIFDQEKCDFVVNAGDVFEGAGMHSDQTYESFVHGFDDALQYGIDNYPVSKRGIKSYLIGGSHDMSHKKATGANIVRALCKEREDLIYRGEESASFSITGKEWFNINLLHPAGGASYARSYKLQKQTEALLSSAMESIRSHLLEPTLTPRENIKVPMILLVGHYHQASYLPQYLGIDSLLLPCMQSQTAYLKRKSLFPQVGFVILTLEFDERKNTTRIIPDFRIMTAYVKDRDY